MCERWPWRRDGALKYTSVWAGVLSLCGVSQSAFNFLCSDAALRAHRPHTEGL